MKTFARRTGAAGALALLAIAILPASPASADATVAVNSPTADQEFESAGLTVTGQVTLGSHQLAGGTAYAGNVSLRVMLAGRPDITATDTPSGSGAVSFPIPAEKLNYNGKYDATISAPWKHTGLAPPPPNTGTATATVSFLVAVPPARPADVKAAVDASSRQVTVAWDKNTEPDLIRYDVKRANPGSSDFSNIVGKVKAGTTTFLDTTTAGSGGDYRYVVVAVRNGIPGRAEISSDPSSLTAEATAKVPDPPPPPTTAPPPGTGTGTGTGATGTGTASSLPAGSPGALATSGTVDLSGFNTVRSQTKATPPRTVALPDPGFQGTLPFDTSETTAGDGTSTGAAGDTGEQLAVDGSQYRELGNEASANDRARTMAFFAAGLLATVLLMHVLWVKSEVKREPLEALDPDGPVAGASTGRRGRNYAAPGPTLEDALDADFAPVVVAANGNGARHSGRSRQARKPGTRREKVSTGS